MTPIRRAWIVLELAVLASMFGCAVLGLVIR